MRHTLAYRPSEEDRKYFSERIEWSQRNFADVSRSGWWTDAQAEQISIYSQMLCGVRPYQWDAMDREAAAK